MKRPTVLVASTSKPMARVLELLLRRECQAIGLRLLFPRKNKAGIFDSAEDLFDFLSEHKPADLADMLVLIDLAGTDLQSAFAPQPGPMGRHWHWTANRAGVATELLLRFPQVYPLFLSLGVSGESYCKLADELRTIHRGGKGGEKYEISKVLVQAFDIPLHFVSPLDDPHTIFRVLQHFAWGMRCWFDPTGLRTLVKNRFLGTVFGNDENWSNTWTRVGHDKERREVLLDRLNKVAVAIDEEREFTMFNAYTAWKYGRRAWIVTTHAEFFEQPLWDNRHEKAEDVLVLRDIDLRFPDIKSGNEGVRRNLMDIDQWKDRLGDKWCARAVSGEKKVVPISYLYQGKNSFGRLGQRIDTANIHYLGFPKPLSTLYALKAVLGSNAGDAECSVTGRLGTADELDSIGPDNAGESSGHGAPHINLAIAESLLEQAQRCTNGREESLIGALLASEAYELLLGMSKTTALEALQEMHRAEVRAEVFFPGVTHDLRIDERKRDIRQSLDSLYENHPNDHGEVKNLFLAQVWADLKAIYRDAERFDAAEQANIESLVHSRWLPQVSLPRFSFKELGKRIRAALTAFRTNKVKTCLKRMLIAPATSLCGWGVFVFLSSLAFTLLYYFCGAWGYDSIAGGIGDAPWLQYWHEVIRSSMAVELMGGLTDLGKNNGGAATKWVYIVSLFHLGFSYLFFGLLISMLYRKITRG